MFASHFARVKTEKRDKKSSSKKKKKHDDDAKREDNSSASQRGHKKGDSSRPKEQVGRGEKRKTETNTGTDSKAPKKRRRHNERGPRRVRPTQEALDLSKRLQDLSRQKKTSELIELFWRNDHENIRDNHHACIVVDCCSRCGDVETAEKVVNSLPQASVSIETKTALLKCYAHSGDIFRAIKLFRQMREDKNQYLKPNVRTLNTLLRGCLWTASIEKVVEGKTVLAGGVVSCEEAWSLYKDSQTENQVLFDTSSYEISITLLCQALRLDEARKRIQEFQEQYGIKVKGKASIKGGDQGSLETCGIAYLGLARAWALLGNTDEMWTACQRCLHAVQSSRSKLKADLQEEANASETAKPGKLPEKGGKRGWKVDLSEEGQKRAASNTAYRKHRLTEVENEARSLLKRRKSATEIPDSILRDHLQYKLLYFGGGAISNVADGVEIATKASSAALWHSFGLGAIAVEGNKKEQAKVEKRLPLTADGFADIAKIFGKMNANNAIDVEIGSGFGDWIVRQALAFADRNHFAIELRTDRVYQIFARAALAGAHPVENLCTVGSDSGTFLRDRLAKESVASIFANHPEPPTQTMGQSMFDTKGIMDGGTEPVHMLNSVTLGWATDALKTGGRIVIVTDNWNFGNLVCATFVRVMRQKQGKLRCLDAARAKKLKLQEVETFPDGVTLYEGNPCIQLGHARDEMLTGQSYFDRLWKTGAGSHSETIRRYLVVMYKC